MNISEYIKKLLFSFFSYREINQINLYNEMGLQHELGIYLRNNLLNYNIEFEVDITQLYPYSKTIKRMIDIVITSKMNKNEKYAIELKAPRNGQVPEQMFSFAEDIKFMEETKKLGFTSTFTLTHVDDHLFYQGDKVDGIYRFFRNKEIINGIIKKPTGKEDKSFEVEGKYRVKWNSTGKDNERFYIIKI